MQQLSSLHPDAFCENGLIFEGEIESELDLVIDVVYKRI